MKFEIFKNVYYDNIFKLYELAQKTPDNLYSVKTNYNTQKKNIQENLNFLINLNFFTIQGNKISINQNEKIDFKENIIKLIFNEPIYATCLKSYLENFTENSDKTFTFIPTRLYNHQTSDIRNFLITMKYLKNIEEKYILLKPEIIPRIKIFKFSPEKLEKRLIEQKILGLNAEKEIMIYEKNILKLQNINLDPIHISTEDVSCGYDIISYRNYNNKIQEIFIEVKAVSFSNYQFHFSISEYQSSIKHGEKFYIYLLPVDKSLPNKFDINKLVTINNIKENIFENKIEWQVNPDGYLISKRSF